jgi:hypothetical protein
LEVLGIGKPVAETIGYPELNEVPAPALPVLEEDAPRRVDVLPADFPVNAKPFGDGSYVLHFDYPVHLQFKSADEKITTETHKSLHLKRLNGKGLKIIREAAPEDFRAQVIAVTAGVSLGKARLLEERMDAADIAAVLIVYRFFTTPGRRTGP